MAAILDFPLPETSDSNVGNGNMSSELGYLEIMGVAFGISTISILQAEIHETALKVSALSILPTLGTSGKILISL